MKTDSVTLNLSGFEQRLMVNSLVGFRNSLLGAKKPTEDVEDLILKVIDAPPDRTFRCKRDRGAR